MKLDEQAMRRAEFIPGREIVLCDGQPWTFPSVEVNGFYPTRGADNVTKLVEGYNLGAEYDRLTDAYMEVDETDMFGQVRAICDLAFHLLSRNYVIEFSDLRHLIRLETGDGAAACRAVLVEVAEAALGRSPKATAVGDEPV